MPGTQTELLIEQNIALAPLTTLKVGGAARFFAAAKNTREVIAAVEFAEKNNLKLFILGGGSNVLISDDGFDGFVLQINLKGIEIPGENVESVFVTAGAGEDWDEFVKFCVKNKLAGVECLSGIPGWVGGVPVQNVGAYGQEVSETIVAVCVFDTKTKEILELKNQDCQFSYRASIFNTAEKDRFIVLSVTFRLKKDGAPKIVYRDLHELFGEKKPTLAETRRAVLKIRRAKSMVIDENDRNSKSVGSFFKNPIVSNEKFARIVEQAKNSGIENIPHFTVNETHVKIPAARLIENTGFQKGFKLGNAGLSTKHTLAIVNLGNATAKDILSLKEKIQKEVKQKFTVELQPEPVFVGFELVKT